eukprot:UN05665
MKQLSKLDQLDYEGTQYVRNNKEQYTNIKKRRKMKTELCNKNVYINQLFEHYEYYESKSEILKQQIKHIEFTIIEQVDSDASIDALLDIFDLQIIRKEMLCCDIALKLNEIHRVLDEHPCSNGKVCKDGKSKEEFAQAVVDGPKTYNKYLATKTTQYWRSQIMQNQNFTKKLDGQKTSNKYLATKTTQDWRSQIMQNRYFKN